MEDYWVFSVYNIYGRKSTFSTYFVQSDDRLSAGQVPQAEAHRVSIIGTMVPSISYNFKF
jgi:stage III sporulation protein SpoIIIAA